MFAIVQKERKKESQDEEERPSRVSNPCAREFLTLYPEMTSQARHAFVASKVYNDVSETSRDLKRYLTRFSLYEACSVYRDYNVQGLVASQ